MTIRHLKTFIAVYDSGGISRAAQELHIAQPAVSQTICELERYYGVALFDRLGRGLAPTEAGRALLPKAREAVRAFEGFESAAAGARENPSLKIGATLTIGKMYLPRILSAMGRDFPDLQTSAVVNRASEIENMLVGGGLDIALSESAVFPPAIEQRVFAEDRLIAVCGARFAADGEITLEELSRFPLLLREKGSASRGLLDSVFSERGMTAQPFVESASNQSLLSAAAENLGIAVLPQSLTEPLVRTGELRAIGVRGIDFRRKYRIAFRRDKKFSARQAEAVEKIFSDCTPALALPRREL